ncbi:MAG: DUF1553 domain-containing protein, partial [Verrucomicrobiota bacterium]
FGLQPEPPAPVSLEPAALAGEAGAAEAEAVDADLRRWMGIDGGFELQADGAPPATPWGPGPNSVVRVSSGSQSPFRNLLPPGRLGLRLPAGDAYNGFGQTLPQSWKPDSTPVLHASFDVRSGPALAGGGSWRYYLGHGPGPSAAVELFFDGARFFRRSGDARDPVASLSPGEWHQVQLRLDLRQRKYSGLLASAHGSQAFAGDFASGWDGAIDYTFIDSYGHRGGPKPSLDADNFTLGTAPLAAPTGPAVAESDEDRARRARVDALRRRQAGLQARAESAARELEQLLAEGPVELAYAVSEGTPRPARLQLRGEPDRPGEEVPRGFLTALCGGALPAGVPGSGRLELADWLASPANPLTARVLVNRVWQHHFGQGLVRTPNDFGLRGQPPSHPELL